MKSLLVTEIKEGEGSALGGPKTGSLYEVEVGQNVGAGVLN